MATATAETLQTTRLVELHKERYAHSFRTIRLIGNQATKSVVSVEYAKANEELAFDDVLSAVTEMLGTDEEYGERIDINNIRTHQVVEGKARAKNGEAMVDILQNGLESARLAVEHNPDMAGQVERDGWDVEVAKRVDSLRPGTTLWGVSMAPRKDLKDHQETFEALGYKEDLAYFQVYSKGENAVVAGSFSITVHNLKALRDILAAHGQVIPDETNDNEWPKHATISVLSAEQAEGFIKSLRAEYYESTGVPARRQSINEYVKGQELKVRQIFNTYYPELANAVHSGTNTEIIQDFAKALLNKNIKKLDPELRQELVRLANNKSFSQVSAESLEAVIRYAITEELRKGLPTFLHQKQTGTFEPPQLSLQVGYYAQNPNLMHHMLANNVQQGVTAERIYAGCAGQVKLSEKASSGLSSDSNVESGTNSGGGPQETYGGKDGSAEDEVPDKIRCIKCNEESPKKKVVKKDTWCCPKCKYEVDICTGDVKNEGNSAKPTINIEQSKKAVKKAALIKEKYGDKQLVSKNVAMKTGQLALAAH